MNTLVEQLHSTTIWAYSAILFIIGLNVGSFLNVVILRLPKKMMHEWTSQCQALLAENDAENGGENGGGEATLKSADAPPGIIFPPSHCPNCQTPLKSWAMLPVISYIWLRGKCASCKQGISIRYPLIELLTAGLTVLVGLQFPETAVLPWMLCLCWCLIALSFIDIDHQLLPDNITLSLVWLGLLFNTTANGIATTADAIIGAVAAYLVLWTVYQAHYALTKKQGMGYGDFKLLSAAGAWLGWQYLPMTLLLSAGTGLVFGGALIVINKKGYDFQIPFGPYIAVAFFLVLLCGEQLQAAYLNLIGFGV